MRIIALVSGKGGVGKTTIAINLAFSLSTLGYKVCIMDLNLTTPHLTTELGIKPTYTLNDFLRSERSLEDSIVPHTNFWIIPSAVGLGELVDLNLEHLNETKYILKNYDFLIIDAAPGFGREALHAFRLADEIIIVANPFLSSLLDTIKCKQLAEKLNKKVTGIILNKVKKKRFELNEKDFENVLELPIIGKIYEDDVFLRAQSLRVPVSIIDKSKEEEFLMIAGKITGRKIKIERKPWRKLFNFLRSKFS